MASSTGVLGQVAHFVYIWLPKTTGNINKKRKDFRQSKKRVNISEPLGDKTETSSPMLAVLKSSQGLPSTPNTSKVLILRASPNTCKGQEEQSEDLFTCNLQVVGYKFLSNEKKMCKRSALKRWLQRKTNAVYQENISCDGQFGSGRHNLCSKELFECSLKLDDSKFQVSRPGLRGNRRLPSRRTCPREATNQTINEELTGGMRSSVLDLGELISVTKVKPSCVK
ncbi:uncharacterized protein LOC111346014 [Stylophora pistillata]|uniref:Uncharacterized protein n=1 Tax=Stylophora pistillata TaxID=50429 RepID=A0A2B4SUV3_STYPI|nr:uncharacterized protein LOC111346014 [Stylophora pistillata]PFX32873.1 hypothetical protein AWC38_SpisGene2333 [Stylophora pistillata]